MVRVSVLFFALALGALLFGIYGIGGISFGLGRLLLFVFLALSIFTFAWDLLSDLLAAHHTRHKHRDSPIH